MFLLQAFCSHCRKLDEVPTATEHTCYKVQSNMHAHKKCNMPSTSIPNQMSRVYRGESGRGVNYPTDRSPVLINYRWDSGVIPCWWHLFLILRKLCMFLHLSGTVFLIQNLVLALFCILNQWSISYQLTIVGTYWFTTKNGMISLDCNMAVVSSATVTSRFMALRQKYNYLFAKYCYSALRLWNVAHKWTLKELIVILTMERTFWQTKNTHGLNQRT